MERLIQLFRKTELFDDLSDKAIEEEILPFGKLQEVPKGNHLIRFQEKYESFGIVIKGKINLLHIYGNGNYGIMGVIEQGDLFGVDLMCTKSRVSPYYAEAMQPTQIMLFPADMVLNPGMLREELRMCILRRMLVFVADENMRKEYQLAILFQKGLRDRIMTYLTMQANKRHTNTFTVPFTRDELASYLCVNRTCLSHELSRMEQEGIIKFRRNTFTLLKWDKKNGEY